MFSTLTARAQAPSPPDDATRAAARLLGQQGVEAYWTHDYVAANSNLEKAYRLFATPTLGLYSARALANLGQLVEAAERYREATRISITVGDSAAQTQAQQEAAKELAELQPRIPALTIQLDVPVSQVTISLDGVAMSRELVGVGRPTNPGDHRVVVMLGSERRELQIQLAEQDHKVLQLQLAGVGAAEAPAAPSTSLQPQLTAAEHTRSRSADAGDGARATLLPVAITALALGGVGLATGGITALAANGKCSGGNCKTASDKSSYDTLRTVSTVSIWTGAVLAVGGLATWLLAPKPTEEREQAGLRWDIAPTGVTVRGAF